MLADAFETNSLTSVWGKISGRDGVAYKGKGENSRKTNRLLEDSKVSLASEQDLAINIT